MTDIDIAALATKTADEIERRGWVTGDLTSWLGVDPNLIFVGFNPDDWKIDPADGSHYRYDDAEAEANDWRDGIGTLELQPDWTDHCKVCVLGGARAAFDGKPGSGMSRDYNGYDTFVAAIADAVHPGWDTETYNNGARRFHSQIEVVYGWNDDLPTSTGQATVVAMLRKLAADHSGADAHTPKADVDQ